MIIDNLSHLSQSSELVFEPTTSRFNALSGFIRSLSWDCMKARTAVFSRESLSGLSVYEYIIPYTAVSNGGIEGLCYPKMTFAARKLHLPPESLFRRSFLGMVLVQY